MKYHHEIPNHLTEGEPVVVGVPLPGVKAPLSQRTFPRPMRGLVVGRVTQAVEVAGTKATIEGWDIALDKPHPKTGERTHFVSDFMLARGVVRRVVS